MKIIKNTKTYGKYLDLQLKEIRDKEIKLTERHEFTSKQMFQDLLEDLKTLTITDYPLEEITHLMHVLLVEFCHHNDIKIQDILVQVRSKNGITWRADAESVQNELDSYYKEKSER